MRLMRMLWTLRCRLARMAGSTTSSQAVYLGDMRRAAVERKRWPVEPPATARASRQEQARARMCCPGSALPLTATGAPGRLARSSIWF